MASSDKSYLNEAVQDRDVAKVLNRRGNDSHQDHGNLFETVAVHQGTGFVMVLKMRKYAQ